MNIETTKDDQLIGALSTGEPLQITIGERPFVLRLRGHELFVRYQDDGVNQHARTTWPTFLSFVKAPLEGSETRDQRLIRERDDWANLSFSAKEIS